jgi:pyridoxal phosphate phosphatase PHOSPHO2
MMKDLHAQGKTTEDVVEVLKRIPIHPRIVPAIKAAHAKGYLSLSLSLSIYIYIYIYIHLCFFESFSGTERFKVAINSL